ncbi:hypothetical protein IIA16_06930, partial [bacterium]|nr:hypothetical protein [bacterium]
LAASGHQEAEWAVLGPWAAFSGAGRLEGVRFPQDRDKNGLDDYDGDGRYDEWGTALPFITIDHLSSPWIAFPYLEPPARSLAATSRPGGSLPMAPMVGDYNRDGVVDYLSGEGFNPANPCFSGGYAPCLSLPFMPFGKRNVVYPDSPPSFYAAEREFMPVLGPLVYSAAAPMDPERLAGTTFITDWYAADSVVGERFAEEVYGDLRGTGVVNPSAYADRIKPLTAYNAGTDSWDSCDPDVDTLLARDLALATEGLDFPLTLEVPYDRESDRPAAPAMPDSYPLLDPGTCLPWNAAQSQGAGASYEGVVSDEGSRFPLHGFVHNPDDPFFHNPILLETYTNVFTVPTVVAETCVWARASGSTASAARCAEAHLAQRGLMAMLARGVGAAHSAAILSYIGFHDVGDVATAGGNWPDERRDDFDGDGRSDEIPRIWPANLAEVLDVSRVKLRDGTSAGGVNVNLNVDEWKPFQSTITNWSARGEGTTSGGFHCGLFPFGGSPSPGCADADADPRESLRPVLPSTAWPQMQDPILRCLDKAGPYALAYTTTISPPLDFSECLGWMPKLDLWQTPIGWPSGVTAGAAPEPAEDVLADIVRVDDWSTWRPECVAALYSGVAADPLGEIQAWLDELEVAETAWPEEFWLLARCFWRPELVGTYDPVAPPGEPGSNIYSMELRRADIETAFEVLFDDGSAATAAFPDIMGAQFPQTLSAKV